MKNFTKLLSIFILLTLELFAFNKVSSAYAIGIFDKEGKGENIQHVRNTKNDYEGECFSKIVVFGRLGGLIPKVQIGNSIGHFIKSIPIYNKKKINIAQEITYKHHSITSGYFKVSIDNKLYDTKVFVK